MNRLIEWFANNSVAANLLMLAIFLGGTFSYTQQIEREFFPATSSDTVRVDIAYLGANPSEIEDRVLIRVEEAIQDLEGVKKLESFASDGSGRVYTEVQNGFDSRRLLNDVKARVDGLNTLPAETERPIVSLQENQNRDMMLVIAGDVDEKTLKRWAERIRDEVARLNYIDKAELDAVRDYEVGIEVSEVTLRRYGLSIADVQRAIAQNSLNLPAGSIKSSVGDITLRTRGQAYNQADFENIVVVQQPDGTVVRVGDIATVKDGFEETDLRARYNGKSAMLLNVSSTAEKDVVRTSKIVNKYVEDLKPRLPDRLDVRILDDNSLAFLDRMNMLLKNGLGGLLLVFVVLMLFLRPTVAFWVAAGIAISFFGAIWMMPLMGISLNMISLFVFLLVLGIVVDDAIIVGEAIHSRHERGLSGIEAAVRGAKRVWVPVFLAVISTVIFFAPMLFAPGNWRAVTLIIPAVVFATLFFSLVESLLILPVHLKHMKPEPKNPGWFGRFQQRFANGMRNFVEYRYKPVMELALRWRTVTVSGFMMFFIVCTMLLAGGWLRTAFFPSIVGDFVATTIELEKNAPFSKVADVQSRLEAAAERASAYNVEIGQPAMDNVMSFAFGTSVRSWAFVSLDGSGGGDLDAEAFGDKWREELGPVPEAEEIKFVSSFNDMEKPIDIQVSGADIPQLKLAVEEIKEELRSFNGVYDIKDTLSDPSAEIVMSLRPEAESLSLGLNDLAQQVRQGFFGAEAQRIPRGKDDVRVMVRYPREARESIESLSETRIRIADGIEIPFDSVAKTEMGRGSTRIEREDRQRVAHVTAEVRGEGNAGQIIKEVFAEKRGQWEAQFPSVNFGASGDSESQDEFVTTLMSGLVVAIFVIYAIMASTFRSIGIPIIILTAVPFGFAGAVIGHMVLGIHLSMFSTLGIIAAAGVVVNDNLVLLDHLQRLRKDEGMAVQDAIVQAAADRFRAIILTSLTTFVGLVPLMTETSIQAQFLIPMVVSLAFGVLFSTGVTLVLVPCLYSLMHQVKHGTIRRWRGGKRRLANWLNGGDDAAGATGTPAE